MLVEVLTWIPSQIRAFVCVTVLVAAWIVTVSSSRSHSAEKEWHLDGQDRRKVLTEGLQLATPPREAAPSLTKAMGDVVSMRNCRSLTAASPQNQLLPNGQSAPRAARALYYHGLSHVQRQAGVEVAGANLARPRGHLDSNARLGCPTVGMTRSLLQSSRCFVDA